MGRVGNQEETKDDSCQDEGLTKKKRGGFSHRLNSQRIHQEPPYEPKDEYFY